MALSGTVVWEVQSGGNDANGGGFNSAAAGTDRSQQTSPHVTIDGATITATVHSTTTQLNIVGYTVLNPGDVGNLVKITGGTMTAGTYQITAADTVNNRWTVDRAGGTAGQTGTGRMGGCKATPGEIGAMLVNDNIMWIKGGTYTLTTTTAGAAGPLQIPNSVRCRVIGYTTTRGDGGSATISSGSVGVSLGMLQHVGTAAIAIIENLIIDGNSQATTVCVNMQGRNHLYNVWAKNALTGFSGGCFCVNCVSSNNSGSGFSNCLCFACAAYSNQTGFSLSSTGCHASDCVAYSNSQDGFLLTVGCAAYQCTSYGNSGDGFETTTGTVGSLLVGCVATGNTGYQFNTPASTAARLKGCAGKNDGSGILSGTPTINDGFITLTADPFVNAGSQNFKLNNTAGGGADLRALGMAPYGQTSYRDVGADQHQDSGSTGGVVIGG